MLIDADEKKLAETIAGIRKRLGKVEEKDKKVKSKVIKKRQVSETREKYINIDISKHYKWENK